MRKLSQILAVGVITLIPFAVSSNAFAAGTCPVGYTGPNSTNQCISTTAYTCTVTNTTTVKVTNDNTQITVSGDASGTGNGTSGSVSTGSATNSNGVTFNATVTTTPDPLTKLCTVVATVPATIESVTPPAVTVTPTVTPTVTAPQGKGAVTALADTSGDSTVAYVTGLVGILGAGAVLARLAVMTYSRFKS